MAIRKVFIFIGAASCFALPSNSGAQSNPALYEQAHQISKRMLDDSAATRERAAARVRENNYYEAATDYEALVGRWQATADSLLSYPVLMALGAAHLEAAINLVSYGAAAKLKDKPQLFKQNMDAVNAHIGQVYTMVGTAASRARESGLRGAEAEPFICEASAKLAAAVTVHGIVNSNAKEVDMGIAGYEKIAACVPGVDRVVGTLKGISRNIGGSPMSLDNIASTLALFAREVPKGGPLIGSTIDVGYKYYKESRPPLPPLPR